jgi:hypothetical protein
MFKIFVLFFIDLFYRKIYIKNMETKAAKTTGQGE